MKAKEWLVREGHLAQVTRGRISTAHHLLLKQAADSGVEFSDWGDNRVALTVVEHTDSATGEVTEEISAHRIDGYTRTGEIAEIAPYRFPHGEFAVYEREADGTRGRKRSLREVCATDGVSLVQCTCGNPRIVATNGQGHVSVLIVPERTKPRAGNIWDAKRR